MLEKEINDYTRDAYGERPPAMNPAFWERVAAEDEQQAAAAIAAAAAAAAVASESTRPPPFNPEKLPSSIEHSNTSIPCAGDAVPVFADNESSSSRSDPQAPASSSNYEYEIPPFHPETSIVEHATIDEELDAEQSLPPRSGTKANPPRAPRYYRETRSYSLFRPYSTRVYGAVKRLLQVTAKATSRNVARLETRHQVSLKCQETAHRSAQMVKQASLSAKLKAVELKEKHSQQVAKKAKK